jgi:hypothetical protein
LNIRLIFAYHKAMPAIESSGEDVPWGVGLRTELSLRNLRFASANGLLHELTDGQIPGIIFGRDDRGRHGNFHPDVYERICSNREWSRRLEKAHTASKRARVRADWRWKELDSSNSSDALLMNIFCHPEVTVSARVQAMLGIESAAAPEFGFKPRTPLQTGRQDNTEVDMKIGNLLVEAKLTESDFQVARLDLIRRYRDLETVFDLSELPVRNGKQDCYQLIRGTLAAYATGCSFCVFCDARRPDLIEDWYAVMRAVRIMELRCRLMLLTWQELAAVLPQGLRQFLTVKYGILPTSG